MKIYLTRHGETDWNVQKRIQGSTDTSLNEHGIAQAHTFADALLRQSVFISKIYTSPQKRAMQTGSIVAQALRVPMETADGLQEMNLGLWEGKTWAEAEREHPIVFQRWYRHRRRTKAPGGESYQEVAERVFAALDRLLTENEQDILIVTHGAVLLILLALMKDVPFEEMSSVFKIENAKAFCFEKEELLAAEKKL